MSTSGIRAGRAFVELGINDKLSAGLKNAQAKMRAFSAGLQNVVVKLAGAGIALGTPIAFATKIFADFDDAMRAVGAIAQASSEDLKSMTDTASRLGATTSYTSQEVALLMQELAKGGFKPEQINKMTLAVLDLSRATGTDAALAAGIMKNAIKQFGLEASDATRLADVLTKTANSTNTTVEGIGESMVYAATSAHRLGMSVEETAAFIGILGDKGIEASAAGTALRRIASIASSSGEELKKIFNVSNTDADGQFKPLAKILTEIGESTALMSTTEQSKALSDAFGLLGMDAANIIATSGPALDELTAKLKAAEGTANTTAKSMDAGLGGAFRRILSAVDGVANAIGASIEGGLSKVVDAFTQVLGDLTEFINANQGVAQVLAITAAGLVTVGGTLVAIAAGVSLLGYGLGGMATAWGFVAAAATSAWAAISGPLLPFLPLIALVAAYVAALSAVFIVAASKMDVVSAAWEGAKNVLKEVWAIAKETFSGLTAAMAGGQYAKAAEILWAGVKAAFFTGMDGIAKGLSHYFSNYWKYFKEFWGNVLTTLGSVFAAIPKMIWSALTGGPSIAQMLADAFSGGVGASFDSFEDRAKSARAELKRLNSELGRDTAKKEGTSKANQDAKKLTDTITGRIDSLADTGNSAVHGKNAAEVIKFRREGANSAQIDALKAAQEEATRAEAIAKVNDSVKDQIQSLNEQAYASRHGAEASERHKLSLMGATAAQLAALKVAQEQAAAAAKLADMKSDAASLAEALRSPFEVFRTELENSQELLRAGLIDETTFRRSRNKLQKGFLEANDTKEERQATFREQQQTIRERLDGGQINEAEAGAQIAAVARLLDQARLAAANAGTEMDKQTKTAGTFDGFALGRGGNGRDALAKETAEATKATAENTRRIADAAGKKNPVRFGA
ncbi:phage tail tape measure protein [Allorhodopirellula heiligendammensis]|uniref:Phage-related minor tail protein n=1 Tax=Allorhodopirellula heiligendammensis TaxID=2714739 RepID=A0A5C6C1J2_9BACT|nr:phage tail tape measure protein [Allorhodopirellula heiligendammensis]TWU17985.1 Phage-related minor tail protein [Allorhodopirellula heiligendammensis]